MGTKRWNEQASGLMEEQVLVGVYVQQRGALGGRIAAYLLNLIKAIPLVGDTIGALADQIGEMISMARDDREGRKSLSIRFYRQMYLAVGPTKLGLYHLKGLFWRRIGKQLLLVPKADVATFGFKRRMTVKPTIELAGGVTVDIESGHLQLVGAKLVELESGFWTKKRMRMIAESINQARNDTDLLASTEAEPQHEPQLEPVGVPVLLTPD